MAEPAKGTGPVVGPSTGFHADEAGWQVLEEREHLAAPQLTPENDRVLSIDAVKLEDRFDESDADRDRMFHGWLPSWVQHDSTQCGTLRCREREPSTPSMADKVSPESFFNLLKRERIRRRTYRTREEARRDVFRLHRDVLQPEAQARAERNAVARRLRVVAETETRVRLRNAGLFKLPRKSAPCGSISFTVGFV